MNPWKCAWGEGVVWYEWQRKYNIKVGVDELVLVQRLVYFQVGTGHGNKDN